MFPTSCTTVVPQISKNIYVTGFSQGILSLWHFSWVQIWTACRSHKTLSRNVVLKKCYLQFYAAHLSLWSNNFLWLETYKINHFCWQWWTSFRETWVSHRSVAEDSHLLRCDAVMLDEQFQHFEGSCCLHRQWQTVQLALDCLTLKLLWSFEIVETTMQWQSATSQLESWTNMFHYKEMPWHE
jgi:hypothetical protein